MTDGLRSEEPNLRLGWFPNHRTAVSGATGFLGGVLAQTLQEAPRPVLHLSDLPDDVVLVHLAAAIDGRTDQTIRTNLDLDLRVIEAVNSRLQGLIYASTNNVYPLGVELALGAVGGPTNFYGASKRTGETILTSLCEKPWVVLRIADVFGPGQRWGNFFKAVEAAIRNRTPIQIHGSGDKLRSYIYAQELASLTLHFVDLLRSGAGNTITNACYSEAMTIREIALDVARLARLPLLEKPIADDFSANDVRTMQPGPFFGYAWRWDMRQALGHYVEACDAL